MTPATFLFDLDMTLLDTSGAEHYRSGGRWNDITLGNAVQPFPIQDGVAPHQLPRLLKDKKHPVGIVTSSPRSYAERLCSRFSIAHDLLIAYHDTERHKPDPQPIEAALKSLGVGPEHAYYIGDDAKDIEASHHAGVVSVTAAWSLTRKPAPARRDLCSSAADFSIWNPVKLLIESDIHRLGYLGEMLAVCGSPTVHRGSYLSWQDHGWNECWALGRYFTTKDPRAGRAWSNRILSLKDDDSFAEFFADAITRFISSLKRPPNTLVAVPPKANQRDRFASLLKHLALRIPTAISIAPGGLSCVQQVNNYKVKNRQDRAAAIRGTFKSIRLQGDIVMLLDDVYTTGATTAECVHEMQAEGAKEVVILALGLSQRPFDRKDCPTCGRPMMLRTNSHDGNRFWGCTGFPRYCKSTDNSSSTPSGRRELQQEDQMLDRHMLDLTLLGVGSNPATGRYGIKFL